QRLHVAQAGRTEEDPFFRSMDLSLGDVLITEITAIARVFQVYAVGQMAPGGELDTDAVAGFLLGDQLTTPFHFGAKIPTRIGPGVSRQIALGFDE
ncbi:MAG: hypothetical protein QNJ02_16675, partial [Desulfobacterales bacterium]|nr:hypothetical protein [Desulfobacterales bacterium]